MSNEKFPKTSWTLLKRIKMPISPEDRRDALKTLCNDYWFPVYAFIRRRKGAADGALDSTQEFFTRLLTRDDFAKVEQRPGIRFRSWLLRCIKNHLANEYDHENSLTNGGGQVIESLDAAAAEGRYLAEAGHDLTPERLYERHFALSLLARVLEQLRADYAKCDREALFEAIKGTLSQDAAQRPYNEVAAALGTTETAVRKAAHDLREKYKKLVKAEVARLVDHGSDDPDDDPIAGALVNEELRYLLAALDD